MGIKSKMILGFLLMLSAGLLWDLTKLHVTAYIVGSIGFIFLTFGFTSVKD
jgi:hypothetical protein